MDQGEADDSLTLGRSLDDEAFSPYFRAHFMTPVVSAVWSCYAGTALRYPAVYLFRFLAHHGMLAVSGAPVWWTVTGRSRSFVARIAAGLHRLHTSSPARTVPRHIDGVDVTTHDGTTISCDHAVVAAHADQAPRLLGDTTPDEATCSASIRTTPAWSGRGRRLLPFTAFRNRYRGDLRLRHPGQTEGSTP
ncbi:FAD-dependent oxidoreductase [Streptomyces sp. NPDC056255]|uniref:FAD-dependent oxidoreductase n=1 Tax=Streptomyces sp. NPDC056255 TaxID=3345764 RepID=UPI0035D68D7D